MKIELALSDSDGQTEEGSRKTIAWPLIRSITSKVHEAGSNSVKVGFCDTTITDNRYVAVRLAAGTMYFTDRAWILAVM